VTRLASTLAAASASRPEQAGRLAVGADLLDVTGFDLRLARLEAAMAVCATLLARTPAAMRSWARPT
jgi:hypothetical protein